MLLRVKWMLWLLPLFLVSRPALAAITVQFPQPTDSYSYYYGYPYMAAGGDSVTGVRSASPLPTVNTLSVNWSVYYESDLYANTCTNYLYVYFDGTYVGYVPLQATGAWYGYYTITGAVNVPTSNATNHTIQVKLLNNAYTLACGYTFYLFDDAKSTITMDLVGADADGDGYYSKAYYGNDCDDSDASTYPGASEKCDGKDNNCNSVTDEGVQTTFYKDADGDSWGGSTTTAACAKPVGYAVRGGDCNDSNAAINPGATEICNSVDDDCDSSVDEGVQTTFYKDADGDGYGTTSTTQACSQPTGYASKSGDCNDGNAAVNPAAAEVCNGVDDNCSGAVDEGVLLTWYKDGDGDGYGSSTTAQGCSAPSGYVSKAGDCNDANAAINPGAAEACNGADDDCDGLTDEGVQVVFYKDADGDGYGVSSTTTLACAKPTGYAAQAGDCNDANASINPGAAESCNSADDDCDGSIDEGVKLTYYKDGDGDGYGATANTTQACTVPTGYSAKGGDCNDADPKVNPGAAEACNGIDDDCDGVSDEGVQTAWYKDGDGDGYGSSSTTQSCTKPTGYVSQSGDCDDADKATYPGAAEACDGKDNDCDGAVDENAQTVFYKDADGDGYGVGTVTQLGCTAPAGYAAQAGDCDDSSAAVNPGATETCNGRDDDCDAAVDEGAKSTYYADSDGDGYGDPVRPADACSAPAGYVANGTDCNDADRSTYPGAPEKCDARDNDCDGVVDEGVQTAWYQDADGDGYGNAAVSQLACERPVGYVAAGTDCDDTRASVNPAAAEACNGRDDDCDTLIDEGVQTTWYVDQDGDGHGDVKSSQQACTVPTGYVGSSDDCNDADAAIHPGATEACNGIDEDCDGSIDEDVQTTFYADNDGDGYGDAAASSPACEAPEGYVSDDDDCNDADAAVHPGAAEICGDNIDQDCNSYDLGCDVTDQDGDGYSPADGDCDDHDSGASPGSSEACDGVDNDCNGTVDDQDQDDDDHTSSACGGDDCDDGDATTYPGSSEVCDGVDNDCDGAVDDLDADGDGYVDDACSGGGDCADDDPSVHPGAEDACDGVDNDCDGAVDDVDADGDGYISAACAGDDCDDDDAATYPGADEVEDGQDNNCNELADEGSDASDDDGDGYSENAGDCNDADPGTYPGAYEDPGDGVDNDCDDATDEGDITPPDEESPTPGSSPGPEESPTPDATTAPDDGGDDSPTPEASEPPDASLPPDDGGSGCTCTSTGPSSSGSILPFALVLAAAFLRLRRR